MQPHLKIQDGDIGSYVLLPGDPGRCEPIARLFDGPELVSSHREYEIWTGTLDGVKVSVCSTGIGGPSTAIAVEELVKCNADTLIRVGTAGSMQEEVEPGDLAVVSGSIRDGGTSLAYMPIEFPALANYDVVKALADAARRTSPTRTHIGVSHEKDAYYGQHSPETLPTSRALLERWEQWRRGGALCSEMESATLFIVASVLGVRAGGLMLVGGHHDRTPMNEAENERFSMDNLLASSIEGLRTLIRNDSR